MAIVKLLNFLGAITEFNKMWFVIKLVKTDCNNSNTFAVMILRKSILTRHMGLIKTWDWCPFQINVSVYINTRMCEALLIKNCFMTHTKKETLALRWHRHWRLPVSPHLVSRLDGFPQYFVLTCIVLKGWILDFGYPLTFPAAPLWFWHVVFSEMLLKDNYWIDWLVHQSCFKSVQN